MQQKNDHACDLGDTRSLRSSQAPGAPLANQSDDGTILNYHVEGDDLHPAARHALNMTPKGNGQHLTKHIFTDASQNVRRPESCAWAFLVLQEGETFEQRTFRGAYSSIVYE
eukprot:4453006-Pyramimonas_sp.AAC.1